jgi:hypothetical protein
VHRRHRQDGPRAVGLPQGQPRGVLRDRCARKPHLRRGHTRGQCRERRRRQDREEVCHRDGTRGEVPRGHALAHGKVDRSRVRAEDRPPDQGGGRGTGARRTEAAGGGTATRENGSGRSRGTGTGRTTRRTERGQRANGTKHRRTKGKMSKSMRYVIPQLSYKTLIFCHDSLLSITQKKYRSIPRCRRRSQRPRHLLARRRRPRRRAPRHLACRRCRSSTWPL